MEVLVKSMYPGSLGLSLLGYYGVFADAAVGSKLSGEILTVRVRQVFVGLHYALTSGQ